MRERPSGISRSLATVAHSRLLLARPGCACYTCCCFRMVKVALDVGNVTRISSATCGNAETRMLRSSSSGAHSGAPLAHPGQACRDALKTKGETRDPCPAGRQPHAHWKMPVRRRALRGGGRIRLRCELPLLELPSSDGF